MSAPFTLSMAWRESRASRRRLVLYTSAIALGVAALVAINSFRMNVADAVHRESRTLLGADLELRSGQPFPAAVQAMLDTARAAGTPISSVIHFNSMALADASGLTRLVSVRAIAGGFPFYGTIETDPPSRWLNLQEDRRTLVDPALLVQLDASIGDTLALGEARFVIFGTLGRIPGEIGFESAFGPRMYIPAAYVEETGLLRFGSRVRYRTYLKLDGRTGVETFLERYEPLLEEYDIGYDTFAEREEDFADVLDALSRFLGLVGLIALLLGGIAVASAVHVFVKSKLETVAVLRCLGATQRIVFVMYLLQAAAIGFIGSASGVLLGLVVQESLPDLLENFLPLDVQATLHWPTILAGLGVGVWVAVAFALLPLLQVRGVSPLQALRHEFNGPLRRTRLRYLAMGVLGVSVLGLAMWQAPVWQAGLAFAGALGIGTGILWVTAWGLTRLTRRFFPRRARYVVRQGIANLYRPHNQTLAVILAVGAGVFLIGTLYIVQRNLLDQIALDRSPDRPNVVVFEVQRDQRAGVEAVIRDHDLPLLSVTPIVSARLARLNGRPVDDLLADTTGPPRSRWPLTREYRHTYRDSLVASEQLVAGHWWDDEAPDAVGPVRTSGLARISVEEGLASELAVDVGDRISWDVQGVQVETEIASLRTVEWARLEPNFFVVFEPGVLEEAPHTIVALTRAETALQRAVVQRDLVRAYPNVVAADLTQVQETIDSVIDSVTVAIRFMALFSIASGLIVLVGSIATSRFQRTRESVLLKTLGARARHISQILFTEYVALGLLAGLTGIVLSSVAGWALVTFLFELDFRVPAVHLIGIWVVTTVITVAVGVLNSRDVLRKAPLEVLRQMGD